MPRFTLAAAGTTRRAARCVARGRQRRDGGRDRACAGRSPKRRDSRRTACRACRSTRRTCATAAPTAPRRRSSRASAAARCWSMRATVSRFPRARWRSTRRSRRAREHGVASQASPTATISASRPITCAPVAAAGMVGLAFGNSPAAMPAAGGARAAVRHQSDRGDVSAPRRRRRCRSTCRCREVARGKVMVAAQGGQADSARAGRSIADGKPTTDREGRARRLDARRWAAPRARCSRWSSSCS